MIAPLMTPKAWSFLGKRKRRSADVVVVEDSSVWDDAHFVHRMIEAAAMKYSG